LSPRSDNPSSAQGSPWAAYEPTPDAPWDLRRVVHLHRRAGFAATWAEIQRDLKDGPEASVARVLAGTSRIGGASDEFESTSALLADAAVASGDPNRLAAWWTFRMLNSPDPLGERLTLMWHGHFATARSKVDDLAAMRRQNDNFRRLARVPFGALLNEALREPALLLYLDAPSNRKDHPNENLARELMELFTLGIGNYTEDDVKQAARALTGWTVEDGAFLESKTKHDDGEKSILGRAGKWGGADLLAMLRDHPATPRRLARRLCGLLMGERAVDDRAIDGLADELRANQLDIGRGVETVLRSRAFFAQGNIGSRVVGPVEFIIGACRALVPAGSTPSTLILADWMARLGQELFEPPNVGGWPGGRAWLTPRSLAGRANFAAALVEGRAVGLPAPIDALVIADPGRSTAGAASALLLGIEPPGDAKAAPDLEAARRALATALASPEAQLG
jgi:uncharacterized protein (DUF1800 family)